jgi:hypothetical protein
VVVFGVVESDGRLASTSMPNTCGSPTMTVSMRDVGSLRTRFVVRLGRGYDDTPMPTMAGGKIFVVASGDLYAIDANGCGSPTECSPLWSTAG